MSIYKPINYFWEAFVHPFNIGVVLMATITAFYLSEWGMASHIILSYLMGIELTYLGVVPNLSAFQHRIKRRKAADTGHQSRDKTIFKGLDQKSRRRFLVLKHITRLTRENFDRLPYSSQGLLENIRKKVEELLTHYMQLLELNFRYKQYISKTNEKRLKEEINSEEEQIKQIRSEKLRKSRQRRLNILSKRLKKLQMAKENNQICESHLETIEDAIRYIYEQSMTMSDPQKIGYQLDNLLSEVEETSEIVEELDHELIPVEGGIDDLDIDPDFNRNIENINQQREGAVQEPTAVPDAHKNKTNI